MTGRQFTHFVIFAEMRTGSNFLESNINQFPDLRSWGELFNPVFVGGPRNDDVLGITLAQREKDPHSLLAAIKAHDAAVIPGFRFFHDHDPRILESCLHDPLCGKVILTRNPLDCHVSRKIAQATGQWKLTNIKHRKDARIRFDFNEFQRDLDETQQFRVRLLRSLQITGQTAFHIHYDDLQDVDVLNGLARFLGSNHQVQALDRTLKRQNVDSLESKVVNYDEMVAALATFDCLNLSDVPGFEPRRGAGVPGYLAGEVAPILYLPVAGVAEKTVEAWLAAHEARLGGGVLRGFNQKILRQWRAEHPGFAAVTVVAHPLQRAYRAYQALALPARSDLRDRLISKKYLKMPRSGAAAAGYDRAAHQKGFLSFLLFLKACLAGQTGERVIPAWASQSAILRGVSQVVIPAHVISEDDLQSGLAHIEHVLGLDPLSVDPRDSEEGPFSLDDAVSERAVRLTRDIYAQDFLNFGFSERPAQG